MGRKRHTKNHGGGAAEETTCFAKFNQGAIPVLLSLLEMKHQSRTSKRRSAEDDDESTRTDELKLPVRLIRKAVNVSLKQIAKALDKSIATRTTTVRSTFSTELNAEDKWLLHLEEMASQTRSNCQEFMAVIHEERDELQELNQQIEALCQKYSHLEKMVRSEQLSMVQVTIMGRSLVSQFFRQLRMEEQIMNEILSFLTNLYDGLLFHQSSPAVLNQNKQHSETIRQWDQCLKERVFLDKLMWSNLADLVANLSEDIEHPNDYCLSNPMTKSAIGSNNDDDGISIDDRNTGTAVSLRTKYDILRSPNIETMVDTFIRKDCKVQSAIFVLLEGDAGNGKTYLCDKTESKISEANQQIDNPLDLVSVIRPSLPLDIMGTSVGETEDTLISMFVSASAIHKNKSIVILDDVEHLLGNSHAFASPPAGTTGSTDHTLGELHISTRTRSAFLAIMNTLQEEVLEEEQIMDGDTNQMLVICTARHSFDEAMAQFDKVFYLEPPNDKQRGTIVASALELDSFVADSREPSTSIYEQEELAILFTDVVSGSIGKSYAELALCCRETLRTTWELTPNNNVVPKIDRKEDSSTNKVELLREMKRSLGCSAPESVRSGSLDDFVDMNVLSARELLANTSVEDPAQNILLQLPLFGKDAEEAWRQMETLIITPLCRAKALDQLLYGSNGGTGGRVVCTGVLLSGAPGSGKSALAYHCARVAASIIPSLTLLEVSCTSLVHKEVGGSERAVQKLFSAARAAAPCILLMDGIENIAAVRGNDNTTEGTMDRVLSTLLTEIDGVESGLPVNGSSARKEGGIAIIGMTHNPNWIDPALRRPGRLEKVVCLTNPAYDARWSIIMRQIKKLPISFIREPLNESPVLRSREELSFFLTQQTNAMSAAEVIAVCNEACMISSRRFVKKDTDYICEESLPTLRVDDFVSALRFRKTGR